METLNSIAGYKTNTYTGVKENYFEGKIIVDTKKNTFEGIVSSPLKDNLYDQYISGYIDDDSLCFDIDYSRNLDYIMENEICGDAIEKYEAMKNDNGDYEGAFINSDNKIEGCSIRVVEPLTINDIQKMEMNEIKELINLHKSFSECEREMLQKTLY